MATTKNSQPTTTEKLCTKLPLRVALRWAEERHTDIVVRYQGTGAQRTKLTIANSYYYGAWTCWTYTKTGERVTQDHYFASEEDLTAYYGADADKKIWQALYK